MQASDILTGIVLPLLVAALLVALIVFVVHLAKTMKSVRAMVDTTSERLQPTLDHLQQITDDLQPVVKKADPLVERAQLTLDAVNLELMRVDEILEDATDVTSTVSDASKALDAVAKKPADMINDVTDKLHGAFSGRKASEESARLAAAKAKADARVAELSVREADQRLDHAPAPATPVPAADAGTAGEDETPRYYTYSHEHDE